MVRRDRLVRQALRSRFLVTLASGEAFEGVLIDVDDRHVILADTDAVSDKGERAPVDGHLWLPRADVKYMQDSTPNRPGWSSG